MHSFESMLLSMAIMHAPKAIGTPIVRMSRTIFPVESTTSSSSGVSFASTMPAEYGAERMS